MKYTYIFKICSSPLVAVKLSPAAEAVLLFHSEIGFSSFVSSTYKMLFADQDRFVACILNSNQTLEKIHIQVHKYLGIQFYWEIITQFILHKNWFGSLKNAIDFKQPCHLFFTNLIALKFRYQMLVLFKLTCLMHVK